MNRAPKSSSSSTGSSGSSARGERLAEYGPGALLGERAHLEGGIRTSSNIAVTPCRVALFEADLIDRSHLEELSVGHRREDRARD